jgi:hypothetical protein
MPGAVGGKLLPQRSQGLQLGLHEIEACQSPQSLEELRRLPNVLAQLARADAIDRHRRGHAF